MNANKWLGIMAVLFASCIGMNANAVQGLDASGNSKVDSALAKRWSSSSASTDGYKAQQANRVVNVGSRRSNDCTVNVGTVQPGQKAPRDIVVTTKEVINVCK
jgi:hypothetical protein